MFKDGVAMGKARVLVADDDLESCHYIRHLLHSLDESAYQVEAVHGFQEARQALEHQSHDVYLIDYRLGQYDGMELVREANRRGLEPRVLLMTGMDNPKLDSEALELGAADYINKTTLNAESLGRSIRYSLKQAATIHALRENQKHFNLFMKNMPCAVCIKDEEGRYVYMNDFMQRTLGHVESGWLGRTDAEIWPTAQNRRLFEVDPAVMRSDKPVQTLESFTVNHETRHWIASRFPIQMGQKEWMLGVTAIDITEQIKAQNLLRQTTQMLDGILTHLPVIAARVDGHGFITEIRGKGLERFGQTEESMMGRNLHQFPKIAPHLRRALAGESVHFHLEGQMEGRPWHLDSHIFFDEEAGKGAICFARDITDRKTLEKQLLDISTQEQLRIGSDLHDDLGQNLTGIACLCSSLQERLQNSFKSRRHPLVVQVGEIARLVQNAIRHTRALARGLCPVQLEIGGLQSALEDLSYHVHKTHGIECRCQFDCDREFPDHGIAIHLYKIVQEALNNTVKHASATKVVVGLNVSGSNGLLWIEDNGVGFDEQAEHHHCLGLQLMRYRCDLVGGSLELRSGQGRGTLIKCHFKLATYDQEQQSIGIQKRKEPRQEKGAAGR